MGEFATIPKSFVETSVRDYEFLRREGLKHIENLTSDIWTDYNAHDPGITILEALCYAITELGYRCGFDMKDLMTGLDGKPVSGQTFFTAKEILTINPLTKSDYRKLLIDIPGIHNAWMISDDFMLNQQGEKVALNEIPIYADCKKDELTFIRNQNPLFLSGLYHVLLDLDIDDTLGDLNNGQVVINNPLSINFNEGEFLFQVILPSWNEADFNFAEKASDVNNIQSVIIAEKKDLLTQIKRVDYYEIELTLSDSSKLIFTVFIPKKPASGTVLLSDVKDMFDTGTVAGKTLIARIFDTYRKKVTKARNIVREVTRILHMHRNLCEDFLDVSTIDVEEIGFCFDADVDPAFDIEKIQAEMFYLIENYLNPSVEFYSLKELLDKKIPVDEIFSGPILEHGFIDNKQLAQTNLRSVIHSSDIINLLMDIEGVRAIRNFLMTKYDKDGKAVTGSISQKWCIDITRLRKPVLSLVGTKIILFKNQFPFQARYNEVYDSILILHALRSKAKLNGHQSDLEFPLGNKRDTESYWPIQYDLPPTYGTGEAGLPSEATNLRIAQQRQLKAYLMFYEQLLANFFSQISNAHKLFSTEDIKHTYFTQYLKDIKDIEHVYKNSNQFGSLNNVITNANATTESVNGWQSLFETRMVFEDRRSRFLDHLLSRFAESFNDYALLMYRIKYLDSTEEKISFAEITNSKTNLLQHYPEISSTRAKAFNYFPQKNGFTIDNDMLWDTDNVSGQEKRISALTGIKDATRRYLYCINEIVIVCERETVKDLLTGEDVIQCFHKFTVTSRSGIRLNSKKFDDKKDAEQAVNDVRKAGKLPENYEHSSGKLILKGLLESELVLNDVQAAEAINELLSEFNQECGDPVGLHLVEHILLRPRDEAYDLMQVCLHDCDCLCEQDPYTFRISVVLPYWPQHFDNIAFREYFETKIREEAPAHVMLKICWLSNELMREFEGIYKNWIEALAYYSLNKTISGNNFIDANNKMLEILSRLHSEYPEANLHDCDDIEVGKNSVMLNKTVLGSYKN